MSARVRARMRHASAATLVAAVLLAAPVGARAERANAAPAWRDVAAQIENAAPVLLRRERVPGLAIALVQDGEVVYARGFGHADVAAGRPVTRTTVFNAGSLSKTVTAWAVMDLARDGRLSLDAPVGEYLRQWSLPVAGHPATAITVRRVLSHTAGLSFCCYLGTPVDAPVPSLVESLSGADVLWEDVPRTGESVRVDSTPGERWRYSGGGYAVLQALIEDVTARPFEAVVRERVFEPFGMSRSGFNWSDGTLAQAARPYGTDASQSLGYRRFAAAAAAGLHTTLDDLARFAARQTRDPTAPTDAAPRADVLDAMWQPAPGTDTLRGTGRTGFEVGYGLGYFVLQLPGGTKVVGHTGSNDGWSAALWIAPRCRCGIVALANSNSGRYVAQRWTLHLLELWHRFEVDP